MRERSATSDAMTEETTTTGTEEDTGTDARVDTGTDAGVDTDRNAGGDTDGGTDGDTATGTRADGGAGHDLASAIGPLRRRLLARGQEIGVVSAREAERRARAVLGPGAISHQRINQILVRGVRTGGLSDETIASLAIAFRLAESEVRRLVAAEQYQLSENEVHAPGDEVASVVARAREALTPAEFRQWQRAWIHHGEATVAAFRSHIAD